METTTRTHEDITPKKIRRTHVTSADSAHRRRSEIAQEIEELDRREAFGEFDTTVAAPGEISFDDYIESRPDGTEFNATEMHYDETLGAEDFSGESLDQLAQRVAQARAEGDKTKMNDAEEAFYAKFSDYSDKYHWEDEDNNGADDIHFTHPDIDNHPVSRGTIDSRLQRYADIMYADNAKTAQSTAAETTNSSSVDTDDDLVEVYPINAVNSHDSMSDLVEVGGPINATTDRASDLVEVRPINLPESKTPETETHPLTSKWGNILGTIRERALLTGGILSKSIDKVRGASTSAGQLVATKMSVAAHARRERSTESHSRIEMNPKKKFLIFAGGLATAAAGIYLARHYGLDIRPASVDGDGFGFNSIDAETYGPFSETTDSVASQTDTVTSVTESVSGSEGGSMPTESLFSADATRIEKGEGWFNTFDQMNIPSNKHESLLKEIGPQLERAGSAYFDTAEKEYRMNEGNGKLSSRAMNIISKAAKARGIAIK